MQKVFLLIVFVNQILLDNVKGAEIDISLQIGEDLLLNVTKKDILKKFHTLYVKYNSKVILVVSNSSGKPTVEKNDTERIEYFGNEGFFKLKNLQKSDSGVYSVWGAGDTHELLETYNVTVKDQNTATTVSPTAFSSAAVSSSTDSPDTVSPTAFSPPAVSSAAVSSSTVSPTDSPTVFPTAIAVLVIIAVAVAAILLWRHLKKKCRNQKEVVPFSANSGTNSPNVQILLPPPQENGALHLPESDHLMEENTGDSAV